MKQQCKSCQHWPVRHVDQYLIMLNHKHGETNKRQPEYAEDGSEEVELQSAKPLV